MTVQSDPPMGRRRTRDFDLPPRMYRRGERLYYVDLRGKWHPLGTDLARAKHLWADFECTGTAGTVDDLVQRYLSLCMDERAPATRSQYKAFARTISTEWGEIPCDLLTAPQLARWRDSTAERGWVNGVLSVLRVSYAKGVEWGWCAFNPAASVALNVMPVRDRYLDDKEYRAIRTALPAWARTWMDLSYVTGMRPGDPLRLRWDQFGDELASRTRKTKVRQSFDVTADVKAILEEARQRPVLGLYVVATEKGLPVRLIRLQRAWRAVCAALGIENAQPRDVRAKAATDAEALGLDYQALLGHSERRMSDRYLKAKRTIKAPTLRRIV